MAHYNVEVWNDRTQRWDNGNQYTGTLEAAEKGAANLEAKGRQTRIIQAGDWPYIWDVVPGY